MLGVSYRDVLPIGEPQRDWYVCLACSDKVMDHCLSYTERGSNLVYVSLPE